MKISTKVFVSAAFSMLFVLGMHGQTQKNVKNDPIVIPPRECEFNNMILENANREAGQDTVILLLSRRGIKDTRDLAKSRLHTARAYLVEYSNLRTNENVKVAEAPYDRSLVYGGVEIYVKGKLYDVLTVGPNWGLGLGSCASPESNDREGREREALLYPKAKSSKPRKGKKAKQN